MKLYFNQNYTSTNKESRFAKRSKYIGGSKADEVEKFRKGRRSFSYLRPLYLDLSTSSHLLRLAYFELCTSARVLGPFLQIWTSYWPRSIGRSTVLVDVKYCQKDLTKVSVKVKRVQVKKRSKRVQNYLLALTRWQKSKKNTRLFGFNVRSEFAAHFSYESLTVAYSY